MEERIKEAGKDVDDSSFDLAYKINLLLYNNGIKVDQSVSMDLLEIIILHLSRIKKDSQTGEKPQD